VPELARSFNSEFWSKFILQTAQHEPAVRHAITALGSLHEHFESADDAHAANSDFGFQQYIKAIRCIVKGPAPFTDQSTDVALISCILFTAFESLQGHYRSALTHINSGLKVLAEREASGDLHRGSYIPKELLKYLFTRFDTQAIEIGDIAFRPWVKIEPNAALEIPSAFSTLEEAERVFDQYYNTLMRFLQEAEVIDKERMPVPDHVLHALKIQHSNRVKEYQDWCNAFDNYLALHLTNSNSPNAILQGQPHPGVLILQIWRIVVHIIVHINLSVGERVFDTFIEESRSIVELAESFVKQTTATSRNLKVFSGVSLTKTDRQSMPATAVHPSQLATHHKSRLGSCTSHGFLSIRPDTTPCIPAGAAASPAKSNILTKADSYLSPAYSGTESSMAEPTAPTDITSKPPTILKPTFSLSLGLISPLYITIARCRDPIIRRRALHLLYTCNRKEGIWDSRLAARVAQRILEVEEAGAIPLPGQGSSDSSETVVVVCADQIPEYARVRELEVSFLSDRRGSIRYTKSTGGGLPNPDPTEYHEEYLQW
jgi:hypothetical protein